VVEEGFVLYAMVGLYSYVAEDMVSQVMIVPRHKKYPGAGDKATTKSSKLWLEQVDAQAVAEGEEVTLMDWGNCFIRVSHACHAIFQQAHSFLAFGFHCCARLSAHRSCS
jgi:hypothetical protein